MKAVKFSPMQGNNVGDVVISKCIEYLFFRNKVNLISYDLYFRDPDSFVHKSTVVNEVRTVSVRNKISYFLQNRIPILFYFLKKIIYKVNGDSIKYKNVIADSDVVVVGGGNIIMSKMGCDYGFRVSEILRAAKGKKRVVLSCGVGSFLCEEKEIINDVYSNCETISVRDENSKKYFSKYNLDVNVIPDPVFILSDLVSEKINRTARNKIGLNLLPNFFTEEQLDSLVSQVSKLLESYDLELLIINTAYPQDEMLAQDFQSKLMEFNSNAKVSIVNLDSNVDKIAEVYSELDMFFGCRMHSLIFSLALGVPAYGFAWDGKVKGMFHEFYDGEGAEYIVDENNINIFDIYKSRDSEKVHQRLKKMKEKIYNSVSIELNKVL